MFFNCEVIGYVLADLWMISSRVCSNKVLIFLSERHVQLYLWHHKAGIFHEAKSVVLMPKPDNAISHKM